MRSETHIANSDGVSWLSKKCGKGLAETETLLVPLKLKKIDFFSGQPPTHTQKSLMKVDTIEALIMGLLELSRFSASSLLSGGQKERCSVNTSPNPTRMRLPLTRIRKNAQIL